MAFVLEIETLIRLLPSAPCGIVHHFRLLPFSSLLIPHSGDWVICFVYGAALVI